jgi:hypothetical protein
MAQARSWAASPTPSVATNLRRLQASLTEMYDDAGAVRRAALTGQSNEPPARRARPFFGGDQMSSTVTGIDDLYIRFLAGLGVMFSLVDKGKTGRLRVC